MINESRLARRQWNTAANGFIRNFKLLAQLVAFNPLITWMNSHTLYDSIYTALTHIFRIVKNNNGQRSIVILISLLHFTFALRLWFLNTAAGITNLSCILCLIFVRGNDEHCLRNERILDEFVTRDLRSNEKKTRTNKTDLCLFARCHCETVNSMVAAIEWKKWCISLWRWDLFVILIISIFHSRKIST